VTATVTSGAETPGEVPLFAGFGTTAPNPFHERAVLEFGLTVPGAVRLAIYDLTGREVCRLLDAHHPRGVYRTTWNGRDRVGRAVPAGIYYARLSTPQVQETRILVRCN